MSKICLADLMKPKAQLEGYKPSKGDISIYKKSNILPGEFIDACKKFSIMTLEDIAKTKNELSTIVFSYNSNKPKKINIYSATEGEFKELSQFYQINFVYNSILFNSSEQCIDFIKCIINVNFDDVYASNNASILSTAFKVLAYDNPMWAYKYAKDIKISDADLITITYLATLQKCEIETIKNILKDCQNTYICNDNKFSELFGIGKKGLGSNLLGNFYMHIRDNMK